MASNYELKGITKIFNFFSETPEKDHKKDNTKTGREEVAAAAQAWWDWDRCGGTGTDVVGLGQVWWDWDRCGGTGTSVVELGQV